MNKVALITHVTQYAGPGALSALLEAKFTVMCHDKTFLDEEKRTFFEMQYPNVFTSYDENPGVLVENTIKRCGRIDLFVSNDFYPLRYIKIDESSAADIREAAEALLVWPFCLLGKVAAKMKQQEKGYIVLVTSAASERPKTGFSIYSSVRAGASALAQAAACELAAHHITVNAIAPNFLESEAYYPPELWKTEKGKDELLKSVPMGRLGRPDEIGALIVFLASGKADFITGEVINFTGGWPLL
jgi:NAD(P)-dependent dehydrogenase (short-subunit alcohol dehydrogenase family)